MDDAGRSPVPVQLPGYADSVAGGMASGEGIFNFHRDGLIKAISCDKSALFCGATLWWFVHPSADSKIQ